MQTVSPNSRHRAEVTGPIALTEIPDNASTRGRPTATARLSTADPDAKVMRSSPSSRAMKRELRSEGKTVL